MWKFGYKEIWVPKNWCFWTVVLEKTLESPLDCKEIQPVHPKGNQSLVFLEGLTLKLKLQYLGHLTWRTDSLGKTLMLGKIEGSRRRGWQRTWWRVASLIQWTWVWASSESWWWTGKPGMLLSTESQRVGHDWVTELNWTKEVVGAYAYTLVRYWIFMPWRPELLGIENSGEYSWIQESLFFQ